MRLSCEWALSILKSFLEKYACMWRDGKLSSLLWIKFLVTFNFAIIQSTKDALIVNSCGAEAIPILKGGPVILASFLATLGYSKLSKIISRKVLFCSVISFFIVFYAIYGFIFLPFKNALAADQFTNYIKSFVGSNVADPFWAVCTNWIDSIFFIVTELWSTMVLLVSFWGFANHISTVEEAKQFYGFIPMAGHTGLIIGGAIVGILCSNWLDISFVHSTQCILSIFIISCIFTIISFLKMYKKFGVSRDHEISSEHSKQKMTFLESIKQIWSNPSLRSIAAITICYAFCINMIEVGWKSYLEHSVADPRAYQSILGIVSSSSGFVCLTVSILFINVFIKKFGWYFCAQITPIGAAIVTSLFFGSYVIDKFFIFIPVIVIILGGIHNVIMKAMKLSIFDPTREMMYISLNEDAKVTGKTAIDVFGFRFGKSASSWAQLIIIHYLGSFSSGGFNIMFLIVAIMNILWIFSIKGVKEYLVK